MTPDQRLAADALLAGALADLKVLASASIDVAGEYAPAGWDADRIRVSGSPGERPLPVRLDADGNPTGRALDGPWTAALDELVLGLADAAEIPALRPLLAQPGRKILALAHDLTHRAVDALARGQLDDDDLGPVADWCDAVAAAVHRLPAYLRHPGEGRICQGHPLKRNCTTVVRGRQRCRRCQAEADRMRGADADQRSWTA